MNASQVSAVSSVTGHQVASKGAQVGSTAGRGASAEVAVGGLEAGLLHPDTMMPVRRAAAEPQKEYSV